MISCFRLELPTRECVGAWTGGTRAQAGHLAPARSESAENPPRGLTGRARVTRWCARRTTGPVVGSGGLKRRCPRLAAPVLAAPLSNPAARRSRCGRPLSGSMKRPRTAGAGPWTRRRRNCCTICAGSCYSTPLPAVHRCCRCGFTARRAEAIGIVTGQGQDREVCLVAAGGRARPLRGIAPNGL